MLVGDFFSSFFCMLLTLTLSLISISIFLFCHCISVNRLSIRVNTDGERMINERLIVVFERLAKSIEAWILIVATSKQQ